MAEFFEAARDVPFNEPGGSGPLVVDFRERGVTSALWSRIRVSVG